MCLSGLYLTLITLLQPLTRDIIILLNKLGFFIIGFMLIFSYLIWLRIYSFITCMPYDAHVITSKLQNNISNIRLYSLQHYHYSLFAMAWKSRLKNLWKKLEKTRWRTGRYHITLIYLFSALWIKKYFS